MNLSIATGRHVQRQARASARWNRTLTLLLGLALGLIVPTVNASDRYALVIGIDAYQNVPPLFKARNDATAVSDTLQGLGYTVSTALDADRRSLNQAISQLASRLAPGDSALFYFAGHGVEIDGRNYLLPADVPAARPGDESFLTGESIPVDRVLQTIQSRGARVSMLILDACRDNPFPSQGTRSLGGQRGLARIDPPEGAFILFSAGTGQSALDRLSDEDADPNSIFTRALLPMLREPGLSVHELTQRVRRDVRSLAKTVGHDQFPAYYDQLSGQYSIAGPGVAPPAVAEIAPPPLAPATPLAATPLAVARVLAPDPCATARSDWEAIQETTTSSVLRRYIRTNSRHCPMYAALAQERLASLENPPGPSTTQVMTKAPADVEPLPLADSSSRRASPQREGIRTTAMPVDTLQLAVSKVRLNPRGRNRLLSGPNIERISTDLLVSLAQIPEFDLYERAEIDQLIDEKSFTALAQGGSLPQALGLLEAADYLIIAVIDDFEIHTQTTAVPYMNEMQTSQHGRVESTVRMVEVRTGKLVAADKLRIEERLGDMLGEDAALAELLAIYSTQAAHRIRDRLLGWQIADGSTVQHGRPAHQDRAPAPSKPKRLNF